MIIVLCLIARVGLTACDLSSASETSGADLTAETISGEKNFVSASHPDKPDPTLCQKDELLSFAIKRTDADPEALEEIHGRMLLPKDPDPGRIFFRFDTCRDGDRVRMLRVVRGALRGKGQKNLFIYNKKPNFYVERGLAKALAGDTGKLDVKIRFDLNDPSSGRQGEHTYVWLKGWDSGLISAAIGRKVNGPKSFETGMGTVEVGTISLEDPFVAYR